MFRLIRMMPSGARHLHRLLGRLAFSALVLTVGYSMPAAAALAVAPTVTVGVTVGAGYPAMIVDTAFPLGTREPFFVQGRVVWTEPNLDSRFSAGVDIYFGVIMPGGTTVKTWSPNNAGTVAINNGYAPLARARSVLSAGTFDTTAVNSGNQISYTFSGGETKGLYLVFLFMVPTGTDPTDIQQWSSVSMQPFFVK